MLEDIRRGEHHPDVPRLYAVINFLLVSVGSQDGIFAFGTLISMGELGWTALHWMGWDWNRLSVDGSMLNPTVDKG
jgi:hypothetical protein